MSAQKPDWPAQVEPVPGQLLTSNQQWTHLNANNVRDVLTEHANRIDGYEQSFTGASTWIMDHDLDTYPTVICINAAGQLLAVPLEYPTRNRVQIEFTTPQSGSMRIV